MARVQERAAVYRLYGESEKLLYVGVSSNPQVRFQDHARKPWWSEVVERRIEWFEDRLQALEAERTAIRREQPKNNINGKALPKPWGQARLRKGLTGRALKHQVITVGQLIRDAVITDMTRCGRAPEEAWKFANQCRTAYKIASGIGFKGLGKEMPELVGDVENIPMFLVPGSRELLEYVWSVNSGDTSDGSKRADDPQEGQWVNTWPG
jgi:predicted GIY-YIG superfamily endonuclease